MSERRLFTDVIPVEQLDREDVRFDRAADAAELAQIARRLDLAALAALAAKGRVHREGNGLIVVEGALEAAVTQRCVVTLDTFEEEAALPFKRVFTTDPADEAAGLTLDETDIDAPEPLDGPLDIGAIVVEELALGLDPYPRGPGADEALARLGVRGEDQADAGAPARNPFAALGRLRGGADRDGR